jgi:hypothetical protein
MSIAAIESCHAEMELKFALNFVTNAVKKHSHLLIKRFNIFALHHHRITADLNVCSDHFSVVNKRKELSKY